VGTCLPGRRISPSEVADESNCAARVWGPGKAPLRGRRRSVAWGGRGSRSTRRNQRQPSRFQAALRIAAGIHAAPASRHPRSRHRRRRPAGWPRGHRIRGRRPCLGSWREGLRRASPRQGSRPRHRASRPQPGRRRRPPARYTHRRAAHLPRSKDPGRANSSDCRCGRRSWPRSGPHRQKGRSHRHRRRPQEADRCREGTPRR